MVLEQVAFDIETTGFDVTDEVTVVGFAMEMGVRVFVHTGGRPSTEIEATVGEATETTVNVSTHSSEQELLEAVSEFVEGRFYDAEMLLVAYNGERWNGGFDLPFLRTRYAQLDLAWPFAEVPYADVMPIVSDRFNTTVDGENHGDLAAAYEILCDGSFGELDPFVESEEAVEAFSNGDFKPLILHNVADVMRTRELGLLAERYCSKSEFSVKSLSPTRAV